jgi:hypothetical protein
LDATTRAWLIKNVCSTIQIALNLKGWA